MKYRKKTTIVEAVQWDGDNKEEIVALCGSQAIFGGNLLLGPNFLYIDTLNGRIFVNINDYVVKEKGIGLFKLPESIFTKQYELID